VRQRVIWGGNARTGLAGTSSAREAAIHETWKSGSATGLWQQDPGFIEIGIGIAIGIEGLACARRGIFAGGVTDGSQRKADEIRQWRNGVTGTFSFPFPGGDAGAFCWKAP